MTLIKTPTERALYRRASRTQGLETESVDLWLHILRLKYFFEDYWVISQQSSPSDAVEERYRKVDNSVGTINFSTDEKIITAFVEGKRWKASKRDYQEAEDQTYQACRAHSREHRTSRIVYGICVVGTEAKVFVFDPYPNATWTAKTDRYIDADEAASSILHNLFLTMKKVRQPPTLGSTVGDTAKALTQPGYGAYSQTPTQQGHETHS